MTTKTDAFAVGQDVWIAYIPQRRSRAPVGNWAKVTKVGSAWVHYKYVDGHGTGRFRKNTRLVDAGGYSPDKKAWDDPLQLEEALAVERTWAAFQRALACRSAPEGVTVEKIKSAAALLGLEIGEIK